MGCYQASLRILTGGEFEPGDIVRIELELELTDGRVFGPADASAIISSGFFLVSISPTMHY